MHYLCSSLNELLIKRLEDMRKMKLIGMFVAIAMMSFTFVSCDDDPWDDPYGWYDGYGNWGWDNNYWNQGGNGGNQGDTRSQMAQVLCGEWDGRMDYSYLNEDGQSRTTEVYYTDMKFFQYNQNSNSYSGEGVETDYQVDSQGNVIEDQSQTLDFSWYIEDNGDIYIKYKKSGATFVMDYGSSQSGFHLGAETGKNYDTFFGYMIGTGSVKGDVIYIDFERKNDTNSAKAVTRSVDAVKGVKSFGNATHLYPIKGTTSRFNNRR